MRTSIEVLPSVTPEIRPIRPSDALAVRQLQTAGWLDTYPNAAANVSEEWVRAKTDQWLLPEELAAFAERIEAMGADKLYQVAVVEGRIVGMISCHEQHIGALYVDKDHQGSGVAAALMEEALTWFDPDKPIDLEVADYNERAKAFYRKYRFEEIEGSEHLLLETIPVVKMIRKERT